MVKLRGRMTLYREELKAMAHALDREGLPQGVIAKELGVSQRTISNWLSTNGCDGKEAIIAKMGNVSNNCLSVRTIPHYLVVYQILEEIEAPSNFTSDKTKVKEAIRLLPQERIAQRLGVSQDIVSNHLRKSSEMKNGVNNQLERGFGVNTIAEKLGVDHRTIGRWLSQNNGQATQAIMAQTPTNGHNGLATATHSRYLVVCQHKRDNRE